MLSGSHLAFWQLDLPTHCQIHKFGPNVQNSFNMVYIWLTWIFSKCWKVWVHFEPLMCNFLCMCHMKFSKLNEILFHFDFCRAEILAKRAIGAKFHRKPLQLNLTPKLNSLEFSRIKLLSFLAPTGPMTSWGHLGTSWGNLIFFLFVLFPLFLLFFQTKFSFVYLSVS